MITTTQMTGRGLKNPARSYSAGRSAMAWATGRMWQRMAQERTAILMASVADGAVKIGNRTIPVATKRTTEKK